jgi:hypothetical protein
MRLAERRLWPRICWALVGEVSSESKVVTPWASRQPWPALERIIRLEERSEVGRQRSGQNANHGVFEWMGIGGEMAETMYVDKFLNVDRKSLVMPLPEPARQDNHTTF